MRMTKTAIAVSAAVLALALSSCTADAGGSGDPGDDGPLSAEATRAADAVAAASQEVELTDALGTALGSPADLSGETIYYIPISLEVPYFAIELEGVTTALESVGATVRGCDGQFAPTSIVACMDQAIGAGAVGVITSAIPREMASAGFDKLIGADIPALLAIAVPPADGNVPEGLHYLEGAFTLHPPQVLAAQAVIADSNATAHVLYLRITDSPALIAAGDAGIAELEDNCTACEVQVIDISGARADEIPSIVSTALLSDPSIEYVIPHTAAHLPGAITGVQNANATARIKFATATGTLAGLQAQKSNPAIIANASASNDYFAWVIADAAVRMVVGEEVPDEYPAYVRIFTADNIGSLDLTPAAEKTNSWFGDDTYVEGFQSLWAGE